MEKGSEMVIETHGQRKTKSKNHTEIEKGKEKGTQRVKITHR